MNGLLAQSRRGVLRWLTVFTGCVIAVAGLLVFILPIPVGLPLIALGLFILVRHSQVARYTMLKAARRHCGLRRLLRRLCLLDSGTSRVQLAIEKPRR
ncbi:MAG: hypothetical protein LJE59_13675 [Chromatiaceae bacterium]|nr:hypothetical protein [Chromatiaceae bacterium]